MANKRSLKIWLIGSHAHLITSQEHYHLHKLKEGFLYDQTLQMVSVEMQLMKIYSETTAIKGNEAQNIKPAFKTEELNLKNK